MRKLIAVLFAITLVGCAAGVTPTVVQNIKSVVNAIVAGVQAECQVSPVWADVSNLIPIYGSNVSAAVSAICTAVAAIPASSQLGIMSTGLRTSVPPVNIQGVVIHFKQG